MITNEMRRTLSPDADGWTGQVALEDTLDTGRCVVSLPVAGGADLLRWLRSMGHTTSPVMLAPPRDVGDGIGRLAFPTIYAVGLAVLPGVRATGTFDCPNALTATELSAIAGTAVVDAVWLVAPAPGAGLWNPELLAGGIRYLLGHNDSAAVAEPRAAECEWELLVSAMEGSRW
ncbi:hypothetical protein ACIQF6_28295 [Kitasatospora sp. NPDC092948]|uniref:hypothetical protein n=1 Tax=Kitasatospora sp. NPDC092948 TaxID=3364088 RepID=UPI00380D6D42